MDGLLLGSGGWIPTGKRETCCLLLRDGDHVLLVDAGTGVQRLIQDPDLLAGVTALDIVLTHFHLDHVTGLSYLPALPLRAAIHGPGQWLYATSTREILGRLLGSPLFAATPDEIAAGVHEIADEPFALGPFEISTRVQRLHTDPTCALRIADALTYCTDTAADEGNIAFATGTRLLLHEAWYPAADTDDRTHTASGQAARIAQRADVEQLVLIHVDPRLESDIELERAARVEFANSVVGQDLMPLGPIQTSASSP